MAAHEGASVGQVSSLAELHALHDAWVRRDHQRRQQARGPLPPLPITLTDDERAWIAPITTFEGLREEGMAMHHCLGTLAPQIEAAAHGRFHAFALASEERGTLAIWRPTPGSPWCLYDLRGPANSVVGPTLHRTAQRLLDRFEGARVSAGGS